MTKKQKEEAIGFMDENGVEFVCAPYGIYEHSACHLCCFNALGSCPVVGNGVLLCLEIASLDCKTYFRKIS